MLRAALNMTNAAKMYRSISILYIIQGLGTGYLELPIRCKYFEKVYVRGELAGGTSPDSRDPL